MITVGSGRQTLVSGGARGAAERLLLLLSVFIYELVVKFSPSRTAAVQDI